jgi:hypothetical protein
MNDRRSILLLLGCLTALPSVERAQAPSQRTTPSNIANVEYPGIARLGIFGGRVELKLNLAPDGNVKEIETLVGEFPFKRPAVDALSKWRFPNCGSAEQCTVTLAIVFSIEGSCNFSSADECPPPKTTFVPPSTVRVTATSFRAIVN